MDTAEIEEVRVYSFDDLSVTLNGLYTRLGDPGLRIDEGVRFFFHRDRRYLWPSSMDDDLSVGDTVKVTHSAIDMTVKTEDGGRTLYRVHSVEKTAEGEREG